MSSESQPITPARFAAALPSLPLASLHSKAAELHNSIAHLQHSNAQLAPFAVPGLSSTDGVPSVVGATGDPSDLSYDQDCADAIRENEEVIGRMRSRLEILKTEVEIRGAVWVWGGLDEMAAGKDPSAPGTESNGTHAGTNGSFATNGQRGNETSANHSEMSGNDGAVHRTGSTPERIGRLTDEDLRRRMQEQMEDLGEDNDDDNDGGMHL